MCGARRGTYHIRLGEQKLFIFLSKCRRNSLRLCGIWPETSSFLLDPWTPRLHDYFKTSSQFGMNARALKARLTPLFESLKQTQHLITRLSKLSAQPSSDRLNPDEENDVRLELSADIHQNLKEQEEDFELLRQEAEDQANHTHWGSGVGRRDSVRERERTDLAAQVARLGEDLKM